MAAKAEGPVPSVATLKPRPELAASEEDIDKIAHQIDQAGSVVIMCGAEQTAMTNAPAKSARSPTAHQFRESPALIPADCGFRDLPDPGGNRG
jgi:thiamine pyrophosphate-dependent acetolactate synthase large subunit-like protein